MLALELDGQPLSRPHGAPARVILPEMYGYKGVKWLARMEVVAPQPRGLWEQHGYDQNAWVGRSNGYSSERAAAATLQPHRAGGALGARRRVLRPVLVGPLSLP